MADAGLQGFGPVQHSISFNARAGTTRGLHAEPWDKLVSVGAGEFFGAWVDLRPGAGRGRLFTTRVTPDRAVFVPRGVANAFQTTADDTVYSYLVNDHWSPDATYSMVNLADSDLAIDWPIPLSEAIISEKDRAHPPLRRALPVPARKTLVVGANGQLGRALHELFGDDANMEYVDIDTFDMTDPAIIEARHWRDYEAIVNAAAFTAVDAAETEQGRPAAWASNTTGVGNLARAAAGAEAIFVHVSSDYVFDGTAERPYLETDPVCPLGVYAQTKAAGDAVAATCPRHYIARASWVVGSGRNFVRTMTSLALRGISPRVVADQRGRLTFTADLAAGIGHLLRERADFGLYNITSGGEGGTWAEIAARVYALAGADPSLVQPVTTEEYFAGTDGPIAPRPANSMLDLSKIRATGFEPADAWARLEEYVAELLAAERSKGA
jgi:dTDP-4-dehydrorhamnose 3,5-epimerase